MTQFSLAPALALLLAAGHAAAAEPALGQRSGAPEQLFSGIGEASSEAALDREIAEAAAHPLGSLANPIRVGGPEGARAYLARLLCADRSRPRLGARSDGGIGAFGTIVDSFPLDCGAAAPGRKELMLDIYHEEHREDRAPPGFTIDPR